MCQRPPIIYSNILSCFTDLNTLRPREQTDFSKITQIFGDTARVTTGGTSNHKESTDVLGEAGEQHYGIWRKDGNFETEGSGG